MHRGLGWREEGGGGWRQGREGRGGGKRGQRRMRGWVRGMGGVGEIRSIDAESSHRSVNSPCPSSAPHPSLPVDVLVPIPFPFIITAQVQLLVQPLRSSLHYHDCINRSCYSTRLGAEAHTLSSLEPLTKAFTKSLDQNRVDEKNQVSLGQDEPHRRVSSQLTRPPSRRRLVHPHPHSDPARKKRQ